LHCLINCAASIGQPGISTDGFEKTWQVNYIGPFLLTHLLLPRLKASRPSRIVNVVCNDFKPVLDLGNIDKASTGVRDTAWFYRVSKLAVLLWTKKLAAELEGQGVTVTAVNPGYSATNLTRFLPTIVKWAASKMMWSPEESSHWPLRLALANEVTDQSGVYYDQGVETPIHVDLAQAVGLDGLWQQSLKWTGLQAGEQHKHKEPDSRKGLVSKEQDSSKELASKEQDSSKELVSKEQDNSKEQDKEKDQEKELE